VKAGGKQGNRLAQISDYVGSRRGTEDSKSVRIGSPVGQNEPREPSSFHAQPSEPLGNKNRISSMALERAVFAWSRNRTCMEAGSNTPTLALLVVGGDEKGSQFGGI
jgi:hypothetical protein